MIELNIRPVEVNYIVQVWPMVEQYLADALTKDNDAPDWSECYNIHHVQNFLTSGTWILLVAIDEAGGIHGAATVSFANYPKNRVAFITLIGGKLISSKETFAQLKQLLKQCGATKIQGYGRESIVRLWKRYGFEPRTTLVEVQI
jgi:hypothetical protein